MFNKFFYKIILIWALSSTACLGNGVVRDVETEDVFKAINAPLVKAMNEDINKIKFRLTMSEDFNAYVSGGKNVYYTAGLILNVDNASQVVAVSAHELGHIKGGHLNQLGKSIETSKAMTAGAIALGILGSLASGNAESFFGTTMLGTQVAQRSLLAGIRAHEIEADSVALSLMEKAKISPIGQVQINQKMLDKHGYSSGHSIYNQTHPASEDRLSVAKEGLKASPHKNKKYSKDIERRFMRVRAKLFGYLRDKKSVFGLYPKTDTSDLARYARAMYYYASHNGADGIKEMEFLIKKYPNDPYYLSSYANILYDAGKLKKAIAVYKKALKVYPSAGLMWIEYAKYNIDLGTKESLKEAEYSLFRAKRYESSSFYLYYTMTALYSKTKEKGKRLLARAEGMYTIGDPEALRVATQAQKVLPKGSAEYMRSSDIIKLLSGNIKKESKKI